MRKQLLAFVYLILIAGAFLFPSAAFGAPATSFTGHVQNVGYGKIIGAWRISNDDVAIATVQQQSDLFYARLIVAGDGELRESSLSLGQFSEPTSFIAVGHGSQIALVVERKLLTQQELENDYFKEIQLVVWDLGWSKVLGPTQKFYLPLVTKEH